MENRAFNQAAPATGEKMKLMVLKCPSCGANLKAENNYDAITCLHCDNTIVPVSEAPAISNNSQNMGGGTVRIEGVKTPSSALAYMENFFEEYDWEAFSYAQSVSVSEIDKLTNSLKVSSADDKNTWIACFRAIYIPYIRKIVGMRQMVNSIIEEYKNDNPDSYSKFDAYKLVSNLVTSKKDEIVSNLVKVAEKAEKYGATPEEISAIRSDIANANNQPPLNIYKNIEDIPEIQAYKNEKNARIANELAQKGINAEESYARAKELISNGYYVEALNSLNHLKGYSDANELIGIIDKYYLINNVLEIEGKLYYFEKKETKESVEYCLHTTENGIISDRIIIKSIGKVITNYADILYYLDGNSKLKMFNFSTGMETKLHKKSIQTKSIYVREKKAYLLVQNASSSAAQNNTVLELDLSNGTLSTFMENVYEILSLKNEKMLFISGNFNERKTCVMDVDTRETTIISTGEIEVHGYFKDFVVYTCMSPNKFNHNLYIKRLKSNENEILLECNILHFCKIVSDKLFYYIGNSRNKSLITINWDGSGRKEWHLHIDSVLFELGGWIYFIKRAGYNSVLCKSQADGSKFSIIAADIEKFISFKNGYLYYIDDASTLIRVRMDGSNSTVLCKDVREVLAVKEEKIIFESVDDRIRETDQLGRETIKIVKSIYAVDFSGSGKIKLAYNIKEAKKYDENNVYYVSTNEIPQNNGNISDFVDTLYKIKVDTNQIIKLIDIRQIPKTNILFFVWLAITAIFFIVSLFGFVSDNIAIGLVGAIVGVVALVNAIKKKKGVGGPKTK